MRTFATLCCTFVFALAAHLPAEFKTCSLSDPKVHDCLTDSVEDSFKQLVHGNKELHISALDPYIIPEVTIKGQSGSINLDQVYRNVSLIGFSKSEVLDFKINLKNCMIYMVMLTPHVIIGTQYIFVGKLLTIPIQAKGAFTSSLDNFKTTTNMTCELFKETDKEYLRVTHTTEAIEFENIKIRMGDFIEGLPQVNEQLHQLLEKEPESFVDVVKPAAEEIWATIVSQVANSIFTKVPLHEIFKD